MRQHEEAQEFHLPNVETIDMSAWVQEAVAMCDLLCKRVYDASKRETDPMKRKLFEIVVAEALLHRVTAPDPEHMFESLIAMKMMREMVPLIVAEIHGAEMERKHAGHA